MSPLQRWLRFNLVGLGGMAVQLAVLALLNRVLPGHYLLATGLALELTLLHNYAWHTHYTWRDRLHGPACLLRFHLANGVVSLAGNLLLMHWLVGTAHLRPIPANVLAIAVCSLLNFAVAHAWGFRAKCKATKGGYPRMNCTLTALLLLLTCAAACAQQTAPSSIVMPQAPQPQLAPRIIYDESYLHYAAVFCGMGASQSPVALKPTFGCGAGLTFVPLPIFVEVGVMGPQANRSYLSGYVSVDANLPLYSLRARYLPQVIFGYSRLFETGHSLDYGLALAMQRHPRAAAPGGSMRLELRDYLTFASPTQHNVMLRVGWTSPASD